MPRPSLEKVRTRSLPSELLLAEGLQGLRVAGPKWGAEGQEPSEKEQRAARATSSWDEVWHRFREGGNGR